MQHTVLIMWQCAPAFVTPYTSLSKINMQVHFFSWFNIYPVLLLFTEYFFRHNNPPTPFEKARA